MREKILKDNLPWPEFHKAPIPVNIPIGGVSCVDKLKENP